MDANGQRFWLLADDADWRARAHLRWDASCRALCLASERELAPPADAAAASAIAASALEAIPRCLDELGGLAYWSPEAQAIVARSDLPGDAVRLSLPAAPSDLAVGVDGVLYVAQGELIRLHDLRGRWSDVSVQAAGFTPWRLASDPAGGVWALDRVNRALARLVGAPLPLSSQVDYGGRTFRLSPENCHPPRLQVLPALGLEANERVLALACAQPDIVWLLLRQGSSEVRRVRRFDASTGLLGPAIELAGARYAYALACFDAQRIAVRVPGRVDAPAYDLSSVDAAGRVAPSGEVYPLAAEALEAPFAHRVQGPPQVPVALDSGLRGAEPLHALSRTQLARRGEALSAKLIDSGAQDTVWHRLYAEALLPPRCGVVAWLATSAEPEAPGDPQAWVAQVFGEVPLALPPQTPVAAYESAACELPHHPGLASWPREKNRAGLWSVLIQDPRVRVRRLVGRYLWLRIELFGDGRTSPEIAALRAWSSRFSYRDRYLPRLYRESQFGAPAQRPGERLDALDEQFSAPLDAGGALTQELRERLDGVGLELGASASIEVARAGEHWHLRDPGTQRVWHLRRESQEIGLYRPQATPADFLERWLANFEGQLTPLEDRIASAHLLCDPSTVPDVQLDWLGAWIGVGFDPVLPAARRRAWLRAAPQLARAHGTRAGLALALDLASGGGVSGGEIVLVEDFRLRRLFSTLLGVDLNVEDDSLLPGLIVSGNSVVGDTLLLGESERAELLALFREEVASAAEDRAVLAFDARLAHRATVLVHRDIEPQDLGLLRRVVDLESPAHADVRVLAASLPLLVGMASLVGVDTYLARKPSARPARVGVSRVGEDYVMGPVSLDPRLAGASAATAPPVAAARAPDVAGFGESFVLDGSASRAASGRAIDLYRWRLLPPD